MCYRSIFPWEPHCGVGVNKDGENLKIKHINTAKMIVFVILMLDFTL